MVTERRDPEVLKATIRDVFREEMPAMLDAYTERLGIDPTKPLELQKDMAFVRRFRTGTEAVGNKIVLVAAGMVVIAVGALFGFHSGG